MTVEAAKAQSLLWWITSIALSVFFCAILFVLFASQSVELQTSIKENNMRINALEQREDRILADLEIIRKHDMAQATPAETAQPADKTDVTAPDASGATVQVPVIPTPSTPEQK